MEFFRKNREADCQSQGCCNCGCPVPTGSMGQEDVPEQQDQQVSQGYRESRAERVQLGRQEQLEPPDCRDHREFRSPAGAQGATGRRESRDQLV